MAETKVFESSVKAFNDESLTVEHFISTEMKDRVKDVMLADGMVIVGRPVVLFQHGMDVKHGQEPIAKPVSFSKGTAPSGEKGIMAKTQFSSDEDGRRLYDKVKSGIIPNWSICFNVIEAEAANDGGRIVKKWELLEYSLVSIPANPDCQTVKAFTVKVESEVAQDAPGSTIPKGPAFQFAEPGPIEKSLEGRVKMDIPWRAMYTIWEGFVNEVASCGEDRRRVRKTIEELASLLEPHAIAFAGAVAENSAILEEAKSYMFSANQSPVVPAPVEPPAAESTVSPQAKGFIFVRTPDSPQIVPANLSEIVAETVKGAFATELGRLKGRVS